MREADQRPERRPGPDDTGRSWRWRAFLVALAVGFLGIVYLALRTSGLTDTLADNEALRQSVERLGWLGPLAVVGLMTLAIVMSPIPSAPIALAAGAAYGHTWGTLYVLIGAEAGALIAFLLARLLGYEFVRRRFGERLSLGAFGSQGALMGIVFATRLMPFLSFDMVSYAAGLTPLTTWRFAVATLAGILPASFVLAHIGGEMVSAEVDRVAVAVLALGLLTGLPLAVKVLFDRLRARKAGGPR